MTQFALLLLVGLSACGFTGPGTSQEARNDAGGTIDATAAEGDAPSSDAPQATPDSAPAPVTLSETAPDQATEAGAGCVSGPTIYDGTWYRVFPLADPHFAAAGASGTPFVVTSVAIAVWKAQGASGVKVDVGTYSGTFPTGSFQPSLFASSHQESATVANQAAGAATALLEVAMPGAGVAIPAGANLAVRVSAASGLELAGTGAADWTSAWFASQMCAYNPPIAAHGVIVTVTGHAQ